MFILGTGSVCKHGQNMLRRKAADWLEGGKVRVEARLWVGRERVVVLCTHPRQEHLCDRLAHTNREYRGADASM